MKKEELLELEQYYLYLYSRNGSLICNTEMKNIWKEKDENNIDNGICNDDTSSYVKNKKKLSDIIVNLIKGICLSDFQKDKKNEGIYYNLFIIKNIKIMSINIPETDLVAIGIFSKGTKSDLVRLYLLNLIISYINYQGDKKDYFNSQNFNKINSIDKMNFTNFNNSLSSKIFDTFLSIPLQIHFWKNAQNIFKKRNLYIKNIFYKNYYLIDLKSKKIILNGKSLYNNCLNDYELNIPRKRKLWKDLLFYCKKLKNDYIIKNDMNFNSMDYKNFFVKVEYKATYPKRTFIIKFLPLLSGMCLIHDYIELKFDENEIKKKYSEKNVIFGYDTNDKIFRNISKDFFENEHIILKQIHFFIIESLFCSNSSIKNFFYLNKNEKIYFSEEILDIIKEELFEYFSNNKKFHSLLLSKNLSFYSKSIINHILNVLYEEYIQINNKEKIIHKSSSVLPINNKISYNSIKLDENSFSLQLIKNDALFYLFNSIKFNKNINPNDITMDLNDENGKITERESKERISGLIERNSEPGIRFSDLLSERAFVPQNNEGKKKIPFPRDSENNLNNMKKSNGGDFIITSEKLEKNNRIKNVFKCNYKNNNKNVNQKNKNNISQDNSMQKCLIDEVIPNINNYNKEKDGKSNKKLIK